MHNFSLAHLKHISYSYCSHMWLIFCFLSSYLFFILDCNMGTLGSSDLILMLEISISWIGLDEHSAFSILKFLPLFTSAFSTVNPLFSKVIPSKFLTHSENH